jgi:hypothetical protein
MFLNSDSEIETRTPAGIESAGIPHLGMSKQLAAAQSNPAVLQIRTEANADPKISENYIFYLLIPRPS